MSVLEPGNFIAGTNIFNETFVNSQVLIVFVYVFLIVFLSVFVYVFVPVFVSPFLTSGSQVVCDENDICLQAELMWGSMDEEVKTTYGKSYFDQKVKTGRKENIQIYTWEASLTI